MGSMTRRLRERSSKRKSFNFKYYRAFALAIERDRKNLGALQKYLEVANTFPMKERHAAVEDIKDSILAAKIDRPFSVFDVVALGSARRWLKRKIFGVKTA